MNRDKQIEEIAKEQIGEMSAIIYVGNQFRTSSVGIAEKLYNAGYRKQSEGEWVQGNDLPKDIKFIPLSSGLYCSNCLSEAYWDSDYGHQKFDYCPNCGAKMKGGE